MKKSRMKSFVGGLVLGGIVGAIIGGFAVAVVGATAFINYSLEQDKVCTAMQTLTKIK
jgi:hypothetical protein